MSEGTPDQPISVIAGKYNVLRLLGRGGMGAVYEAENNWTHRRVAIKVMRPEFLGQPEVVRRFMQEAQATTQIQHPNIVDILDMGQEPSDGSLYIVQEYLIGHDLRKYLREKGRLSVQEALGIIVPMADALTTAHERGIIHRDIKPENLFLSRTPKGAVVPKLIDFGISKVSQDSEALTKTATGIAMGTPYYMSPEQTRGDSSIDGRSDIWSLAAVLYELLSGSKVFDAPNYNLLIHKILSEKPKRIETVAADVPVELANIIHSGLEVERDQRPPSMGAFHAALAAFATQAALTGGAGLVPSPANGGVLMSAHGTTSTPFPSGIAFTPVANNLSGPVPTVVTPAPANYATGSGTIPPTVQSGANPTVPPVMADPNAPPLHTSTPGVTSVAWAGEQAAQPVRSKKPLLLGALGLLVALGIGAAVITTRSASAPVATSTASAPTAKTTSPAVANTTTETTPTVVVNPTVVPPTKPEIADAGSTTVAAQTPSANDAATPAERVEVTSTDAGVAAKTTEADAAVGSVETAEVAAAADAGASTTRPRSTVRIRRPRNNVFAPMRGYPH